MRKDFGSIYKKKIFLKILILKKDSAGNITATEDAYEAGSKEQFSEGAIAWIKENGKEVCSETSDGSILKITGLPYGYYYVTSTLKRWRYDHGNECCKRRADRGQKQ